MDLNSFHVVTTLPRREGSCSYGCSYSLEEFRDYLFKRYSYYHARNCLRYFKKYGVEILRDQTRVVELEKLTPRVARYVIEAIAAFLQYAKLKGASMDVDLKLLRKHVNKRKSIKAVSYTHLTLPTKRIV